MAGIAEAGIITETLTTSLSYGLYENLPALTTIFTYASSCRDRWVLFEDYSSILYSISGLGTYPIACQPSSTEPYYSPAICPSGLSVAAIRETRLASELGNEDFRLWGAACCGSNMIYTAGTLCRGEFTTPMTAYIPRSSFKVFTSTYTVSGTSVSTYSTTSWTYDYDATTNATVILSGTKAADAVMVWWQASDLPDFEPAYASALASRLKIDFTPTSTPSIVAQTASPASTSSFPSSTGGASLSSGSDAQSQTSNGLSTGAKAGIVVGAVFGAALLATAAFLVFSWSRRRRSKNGDGPELEQSSADDPELVQVYSPVPGG